MSIYETLTKDHRKVSELLDELLACEAQDDHRHELVESIRDELIPHSRAEEAVFYNSLRSLDADTGKIMHSYGEHMKAETLLRDLQLMDKTNLGWKKVAEALKKALDHHVAEEEGPIFSMAKSVLTAEEAEKIGSAFEAMKPKIREKGLIGTTAQMVANLMPPRFSKSVIKETRA